jgi:hypothetical protein
MPQLLLGVLKTKYKKRLNEERLKYGGSMVLGLNDALVEIPTL